MVVSVVLLVRRLVLGRVVLGLGLGLGRWLGLLLLVGLV